jgi:pyridoxal phosphate enzyme (YggS family)
VISTDRIEENTRHILEVLPPEVTLVAAVKGRSTEEVEAGIRAGITCLGHNYVQDAERMIPEIGHEVRWHMIGHLQRNKVKKAGHLFDVIETVDSWRLGVALDSFCARIGKALPILVEINSGREAGKTGVLPEEVDDLVRRLSQLENIQVQGLMTMGPRFGNPEEARPYFRATRQAFEHLVTLDLPNVTMRTLSMGMSNSYRLAIEEGATLVRIGSEIFGRRPEDM